MKYEDFSIRILGRIGETYPMVVESPAGSETTEFRLPFSADEIESVLSGVARSVRGASFAEAVSDESAAPGRDPRKVGEDLYRALIEETGVAKLFEDSLVMTRDGGLRIRLNLNLEGDGVSEFASLPWEFLNRGGRRGFLSSSKKTPLVRSFDVQEAVEPLPFDRPLRVLAAMANPRNDLDLDKEREKLQRITGRLKGDIQLDILENTRKVDLFDRLSEGSDGKPYHVLHYMGHGDFEADTGGVLLLEDGKGGEDPLDYESLELIAGDYKDTLRLVFLNACNTAVDGDGEEEGVDPFTGVATTLIDLGIPAVVAMQFPITNDAAVWFAETFYSRIAHGEAVDIAVSEGRKRILIQDMTSLEWATPVLFMRCRDGALFDPGDPPGSVLPDLEGDDTEPGPADASNGRDRGIPSPPPVLRREVPAGLEGLDAAVWLTEADGLLEMNWRTRNPPGSADFVALYEEEPTDPESFGIVAQQWAGEGELDGEVRFAATITRAAEGYFIAYVRDDGGEKSFKAIWKFPG